MQDAGERYSRTRAQPFAATPEVESFAGERGKVCSHPARRIITKLPRKRRGEEDCVRSGQRGKEADDDAPARSTTTSVPMRNVYQCTARQANSTGQSATRAPTTAEHDCQIVLTNVEPTSLHRLLPRGRRLEGMLARSGRPFRRKPLQALDDVGELSSHVCVARWDRFAVEKHAAAPRALPVWQSGGSSVGRACS